MREADHGFIGGAHTRAAAVTHVYELEGGQPAEAFTGDGSRHTSARRKFSLARQRRSCGEAEGPDVLA